MGASKASCVLLFAAAAAAFQMPRRTAPTLVRRATEDGSIAGVRSVSHRETPGLGDKIDAGKSQWILSFNGKSLSMPIPDQWAVKKDGGQFDQFTGATITPRAVVKAVYQALNYFDEHRAALLQLDED